MTDSQRLQIQASEARSELNKLIEARNKLPEGTEPDQEAINKLAEATRRVSNLEVEYRAALVSEQEQEEQRRAVDPDGEETERSKLLARSSVVPFILEATEGKALDGAEREVRAAVLGDDAGAAMMPIDLLLPPDELERRAAPGEWEKRADTVTAVASAALADGSQAPMLERIFTRSIAARLGVAMPSVPVGAAVYPIMSTGTSASMATDGTAVDAGEATFTGHTLEPTRLTAAYLFNLRQGYQLRNYEAILRRDLSAVMADAMDNQIVNGNGTAPNVNGFISELPAVTNPTAVTTWANFLAVFAGKVDGLNAYQLSDLRAIVGSETFTYANSLFRTGATDNGPRAAAYEYVRERIGGLSVSSRIPAASSNIQTNILALTSYPGRNAVAPIWRGVELIRDPYTAASKGQVRLTAVAFWSFKILRETGWSLWKVKTA